MSTRPDRLYELLPAVYRMRDAQAGEPLRALLQVIAEQVDVVQTDIERLYDNWFIETCEDWVVPYIGELLGELPLASLADLGSLESAESRRRLHALSPRRQVAGAIARRRRKGTPAVLEELVNDIAGWPARVVESFGLLVVQQPVKHLQLARGRDVDVTEMAALGRLGTAFDSTARVLDVRSLGSRRTPSRWNIPAVAVFAWRLRPHAHTQVEAFCFDNQRHRYTFSVLGNDAPLMAGALEEPAGHIAQEPNLPAFITRRALHDRAPELYGPGRSVRIWRDDHDRAVPVHDIVAADLSDWAYRPRADEVAVDPELGRIAFSRRNAPDGGVWVTYNEGFPDELGGGEYPRVLAPIGSRRHYTVGAGGGHPRIIDAFAAFVADREAGQTGDGAVIEIIDSGVYQERMVLELAPGDRLELRAADGRRPVIRLLDLYANRPDQMRIRGAEANEDEVDRPCPPAPARLTLDGLLITGRSVQLLGRLGEVVIRHCTLVPGWSLEPDCRPIHDSEPSIELDDTTARLRIERSIVGSIVAVVSEVSADPLELSLTDSVLDATSVAADALSGPDGAHAHVRLTAVRSTVIGRVVTHAVVLGENTIFTGQMHVARRQIGCLRHCSVPAGSRTPRMHRCWADLAPRFDSLRYGTPAYARLALNCAAEIARGADDGGELGVYHDLFGPQRADAARRALDDFTPAGMTAGILFAT